MNATGRIAPLDGLRGVAAMAAPAAQWLGRVSYPLYATHVAGLVLGAALTPAAARDGARHKIQRAAPRDRDNGNMSARPDDMPAATRPPRADDHAQDRRLPRFAALDDLHANWETECVRALEWHEALPARWKELATTERDALQHRADADLDCIGGAGFAPRESAHARAVRARADLARTVCALSERDSREFAQLAALAEGPISLRLSRKRLAAVRARLAWLVASELGDDGEPTVL